MKDCIFCQIVVGKTPAHKVYEDEKFLAFLDIDPWAKGHTLVVPKKHYRWVTDVPQFGPYWEVAKKIGLAAKKALGAESVNFRTIGEKVSHAHIHVVPYYGDFNKPVGGMEEIAKSIAKEIK